MRAHENGDKHFYNEDKSTMEQNNLELYVNHLSNHAQLFIIFWDDSMQTLVSMSPIIVYFLDDQNNI